MDLNKRILYQFPLSLYCEKTRWNLDAKGLNYDCQDLIPGLHLFTAWLLAGQRSLPILRDGQIALGDSTKIALHLEQYYPDHPLIPKDPDAKQAVLKMDDWFDELGDHVRRYCWSTAINSPEVNQIFFSFKGYSLWKQKLAESCKPLLRLMIRRTFRVYDTEVAHSWDCIQQGLIQLEEWLGGQVDHYLVGDQFSLADLTAASMLAPLVGPENSPWSDARLSQLGRQQRDELRTSLAGQWVLRLYKDYRNKALLDYSNNDGVSEQ